MSIATTKHLPVEVHTCSKGILTFTIAGIFHINSFNTCIKDACGSAINHQLNRIAVITNSKQIVLFQLDSVTQNWSQIITHHIPKRPTCIQFSTIDDTIIVADAFGDVYQLLSIDNSIDLTDINHQEQYRILGHFSTITDIAISSTMIATADRDHRIRISRFPQAFIIQSFCLGHEDYITSLTWITNNILISTSNDGSLRMWNANNGNLIDCIKLTKQDIKDVCHLDDYNNDIIPSIAKILPCPTNQDILFFILFSSRCLFMVSGITSQKFKNITKCIVFEKDEMITAICTDNDKKICISLKSSLSKSLRQFQIETTKSIKLLEIDDNIILSNYESISTLSTYKQEDDDISYMRLEWLKKQKKKEMITNWKGKKRKHIDI